MFTLNILLIFLFVIICSDLYINNLPKSNLVLEPLDYKFRNKDNNSELYNKPKPDKTYNQLYNFDKINKMEDEIIYTKQPKKTIKRAYSDSKINIKKKYKNNDYNDYNDWDIV